MCKVCLVSKAEEILSNIASLQSKTKMFADAPTFKSMALDTLTANPFMMIYHGVT